MNKDLNDQNFLIKSNRKIIGPLALNEVIKMLITKKLVGFDEVKSSKGRWYFFKEHPVFSKIYDEIIKSMENSEETKDITTTIEKSALEISRKVKIEIDRSDDSIIEDLGDISEYKEDCIDANIKQSVVTVKSKKYNKKTKSNNLTLIILSISFFVLLYTVITDDKIDMSSKTNKSIYLNTINELMYLANYNQVITLKNSIINIEDKFSLIESMLAKKMYLEAEEILNTVIDSKNISEAILLAKVKNYKGLIELYRQNFLEAKSLFEKALLLYPRFEEASLNLSDSLLLLDDVKGASKHILNHIKIESVNPTNLFLKYQTLFFLEKPFFDEENGLEWVRILNSNYDQKQELLILAAMHLLEENDIKKAHSFFDKAINVDINLMYLNVQNNSLYHPKVLTKKMLALLNRKKNQYKDDPYFLASLAILHYKNDSFLLFQKYLKEALIINADNSTISGLLVLLDKDVYEEVDLYLKKALEGSLTIFEAKFIMRKCIEYNNLRCIREMSNYISVFEPNSIESFYGKLVLSKRQALKEESVSLINRAIGLAPRYLPVRLIEKEILID